MKTIVTEASPLENIDNHNSRCSYYKIHGKNQIHDDRACAAACDNPHATFQLALYRNQDLAGTPVKRGHSTEFRAVLRRVFQHLASLKK